VVQILGVFFFVKVFDFTYVILALIIADFVEIGIMWLFMIPRYRSKMLNKEALSA
jgi:hypothetical protein